MAHFLQGLCTGVVLLLVAAYFPQIKNFFVVRFGHK
jgi:hypothetical protein